MPRRTTTKLPWMIVLLIAAAFSLLFALFIGSEAERVEGPQRTVLLEVGRSAPEIQAHGWVNGEPPEDDLRGKIVVIDAWATWCGPCRWGAPHLVEVHEKYRERGVVFIGLTVEDERALPQIEQFLEATGITWANGYGALETLRQLRAEYVPAMWVIGPDGKIVWNSDARPKSTLEEGIEMALAQAPAQ